MAVEEKVELEGQVVEALKNLNFRVELDMGHTVLAHLAGKMRRFRIRVLPRATLSGSRSRRTTSTADASSTASSRRRGRGATAAPPPRLGFRHVRRHPPGASVM